MSEESKLNSEKRGRWNSEEQNLFNLAFQWYGKDWKKLSEIIQTRSISQIRSHAQKMEKKSKKSTTDDQKLSKIFILPNTLNELSSYVSSTLSNSYKVYMEIQHRLMYSQDSANGEKSLFDINSKKDPGSS